MKKSLILLLLITTLPLYSQIKAKFYIHDDINGFLLTETDSSIIVLTEKYDTLILMKRGMKSVEKLQTLVITQNRDEIKVHFDSTNGTTFYYKGKDGPLEIDKNQMKYFKINDYDISGYSLFGVTLFSPTLFNIIASQQFPFRLNYKASVGLDFEGEVCGRFSIGFNIAKDINFEFNASGGIVSFGNWTMKGNSGDYAGILIDVNYKGLYFETGVLSALRHFSVSKFLVSLGYVHRFIY